MKLGDKVYVRGHGRLRHGIIDKITRTYVHVRYATPAGRMHVKVEIPGRVYLTAEEYHEDELRKRVEYEERRAKLHREWRERIDRMAVQKLPAKES